MTDHIWVGNAGDLRKIPCPSPGVQVDSDVQQNTRVDLSGSAHVSRAPRALRSYTLQFPDSDIADIGALRGLSQLGIGEPPYWLLDPAVGPSNLLPKSQSSPGSRGLGTLSGIATSHPKVQMPDGTSERAVVSSADLQLGREDVPAIPGEVYTGSVYVIPDEETTVSLIVDQETRDSVTIQAPVIISGENRCPNPALGASSSGWAAFNGASGNRESVTGAPRPFAFHTTGEGQVDLPKGAATPGEQITLSVYVSCGTQSDIATNVGFEDSNGDFLSSDGYQDIYDVTSEWLRVDSTVTVPENAATAYLIVYSPTGDFYITAARYEDPPLGEYADGETADWEWSGARYESPSAAGSVGGEVTRAVVITDCVPGDRYVWLRVSSSSPAAITRAQIQTGNAATPWLPGEGLPLVVPGALSQTYEFVSDTAQRRKVSLTLQEV